MATIKEVAEAAGVSVATVSRVLNNTGQVSEELRQRVLETIDGLDYRPSLVARSLRVQKTNTVAVMVPQLDQPFFSKLTFAIQQALFKKGYHTLTCSTMENPVIETSVVDMLLGQRVDGVIVVPTGQQLRHVEMLIESGAAVVLVDRDLPTLTNIDRVLTDNEQGSYNAMRYLLQSGYRHIGVIAEPDYSAAIAERLTGLHRALQACSDAQIARVETGQHGQFDVGYESAARFMQMNPYPTAIFALTDSAAVGAMRAVAQHNLHVPSDIAVMGFDDIPLAQLVNPPLTTVAQPITAMGESAAHLLVRRMSDPDCEPQTINLSTELIIRDTTPTINN